MTRTHKATVKLLRLINPLEPSHLSAHSPSLRINYKNKNNHDEFAKSKRKNSHARTAPTRRDNFEVAGEHTYFFLVFPPSLFSAEWTHMCTMEEVVRARMRWERCALAIVRERERERERERVLHTARALFACLLAFV